MYCSNSKSTQVQIKYPEVLLPVLSRLHWWNIPECIPHQTATAAAIQRRKTQSWNKFQFSVVIIWVQWGFFLFVFGNVLGHFWRCVRHPTGGEDQRSHQHFTAQSWDNLSVSNLSAIVAVEKVLCLQAFCKCTGGSVVCCVLIYVFVFMFCQMKFELRRWSWIKSWFAGLLNNKAASVSFCAQTHQHISIKINTGRVLIA